MIHNFDRQKLQLLRFLNLPPKPNAMDQYIATHTGKLRPKHHHPVVNDKEVEDVNVPDGPFGTKRTLTSIAFL